MGKFVAAAGETSMAIDKTEPSATRRRQLCCFSIKGAVPPRALDKLVRLPRRDRRSHIAWLKKRRIRLEKWGTFATVAGGAAAGLTGLLFVAVSIRVEVIAKSQELRTRATQTFALFVTALVIALFLSIPDQSERVLGIELAALAVITGASHLILGRRAIADESERDNSAHRVASILDAAAPNAITSILLPVAAVLLVSGLHAGLDVLVVPVLTALVGGVLTAWLLLIKIAA